MDCIIGLIIVFLLMGYGLYRISERRGRGVTVNLRYLETTDLDDDWSEHL